MFCVQDSRGLRSVVVAVTGLLCFTLTGCQSTPKHNTDITSSTNASANVSQAFPSGSTPSENGKPVAYLTSKEHKVRPVTVESGLLVLDLRCSGDAVTVDVKSADGSVAISYVEKCEDTVVNMHLNPRGYILPNGGKNIVTKVTADGVNDYTLRAFWTAAPIQPTNLMTLTATTPYDSRQITGSGVLIMSLTCDQEAVASPTVDIEAKGFNGSQGPDDNVYAFQDSNTPMKCGQPVAVPFVAHKVVEGETVDVQLGALKRNENTYPVDMSEWESINPELSVGLLPWDDAYFTGAETRASDIYD